MPDHRHPGASSPTTVATGQRAESAAANYLAELGWVIIDRNWRTRFCEIDIVARDSSTLHIVEVKYRASQRFGAPADYITRQKAGRLQRAALAWRQSHHHIGPYQIDVVSVVGRLNHPVIELLPNAIGW